MNPYNLKNNAMFLSCWHERNRPVHLACFGILIASIILLSFLTISINEKRPDKIWEALFYVIAAIQALVLLLEAPIIVGYLASRERTSETLDFHRNSPQPVLEKIFGLVFGGTWFEWMVFVILFAIELPFAFLPKLDLGGILLFNFSLLLSGIFFQTTAAAFSLISPQKKRGSPIVLFFLFFMFGWPLLGFAFASTHSTFFTHLLGVTAIKYIYQDSSLNYNGWFFTFQLPLIVLQVLVQLPLTLIMIRALKRVFSMPNSPAFAKEDVIRFCFFIFLMLTGFFVASYIHFDQLADRGGYRSYYYNSPERLLEQSTTTFLFMFAVIGFIIGFLTVPSYFKRSKYVILSGKKSAKLNGLFDDGATSFPSILIYLVIGALFIVPYVVIMKTPLIHANAALIMLGSHIIAFAGFLEFFRLGRFRGNKIFFVTTLIVWWVFIPWLVAAVFNFKFERLVDAGSLSPFVGFAYAVGLLTQSKGTLTMIPLIAPCAAAGAAWLLAWQEHQAISKRIKNN
ncbi:MAG: hypothetical protein IT395_06125 [Candidatus Omnitrophica bacterium]|nr:hypothetical protein [Candidatus Omnitrophota bacterium]